MPGDPFWLPAMDEEVFGHLKCLSGGNPPGGRILVQLAVRESELDHRVWRAGVLWVPRGEASITGTSQVHQPGAFPVNLNSENIPALLLKPDLVHATLVEAR